MADIVNFPGSAGPVEVTDIEVEVGKLLDDIVEICDRQQRLLNRWLRLGGEIRRSTELPGGIAIDTDELMRETEARRG